MHHERLHGQEMIPSFLCIPHIPVGYAGGRATQERLPRHEEHEVYIFSSCSSCLRGELINILLLTP